MNKDIALCYSNVAKDSMLQAVHEIKDDNDISDNAVSCEGTWQKRGVFFSQWYCHHFKC